MIRVAMISHLPPEKSGEAPYAAQLIRHLVRMNKVRVIAITGESAASIKSHDSTIETLPIWNGRSLIYPLRLMREITKRRCHITHVHFGPHGRVYGGFFGELMLFLLILLRMAGVKTTMTLHSTWMPWQVMQRIRRYRILRRLSFLAAPFFRLYMKLLNWGIDTLQLSTVKKESQLRKAFLKEYGFDQEKVLEIPYPCMTLEERTDRHLAAKDIGMDDRRIVLIFGFIRAGKGFETALRAMAKLRETLPDVVLLIAGKPHSAGGERYLEQLKNIVKESGIEGEVRFDTRFISEEKVSAYFSASTLLLVPYTESVGASGVIHNYAGYGVPILASDAGFHNRESLGGNLFLFKSSDSESLARILVDALSHPAAMDDISQKQIQHAKRETWLLAAIRTMHNYRKTLL